MAHQRGLLTRARRRTMIPSRRRSGGGHEGPALHDRPARVANEAQHRRRAVRDLRTTGMQEDPQDRLPLRRRRRKPRTVSGSTRAWSRVWRVLSPARTPHPFAPTATTDLLAIPSAVDPPTGEWACPRATRWSALLDERPCRPGAGLLGFAWVVGGRDGTPSPMPERSCRRQSENHSAGGAARRAGRCRPEAASRPRASGHGAPRLRGALI